MLNSTETQYCPWFSHDVRSVVTPIVIISTTMLLFGFIVSWLKSGSGDNFTDSGGK